MRLPVNHALALAVIAALAGCGADGSGAGQLPPPAATGPAADYPMVLGAPFQVGTTTYTPEDRLNYDAVGYALVDAEGGTAISAAHKTLPLPSYVEVTALATGKTALVRAERRGPMTNDALIALSPGAAAQLGLAGSDHAAVRVRRVNPPEQERALLRTGQRAPDRMDTPKGLLDALNRKLQAGAPPASTPAPMATPTTSPSPAPTQGAPGKRPRRPSPMASPAPVPDVKPTPMPNPRPTPVPPVAEVLRSQPAPRPARAAPPPKPAPEARPSSPASPAPAPVAAAHGSLVIQVAAFSTRERAGSVSGKLGGQVTPVGRLWRVRLGPFATQADAAAALAKAKAAGYSDARIQRADR